MSWLTGALAPQPAHSAGRWLPSPCTALSPPNLHAQTLLGVQHVCHVQALARAARPGGGCGMIWLCHHRLLQEILVPHTGHWWVVASPLWCGAELLVELYSARALYPSRTLCTPRTQCPSRVPTQNSMLTHTAQCPPRMLCQARALWPLRALCPRALVPSCKGWPEARSRCHLWGGECDGTHGSCHAAFPCVTPATCVCLPGALEVWQTRVSANASAAWAFHKLSITTIFRQVPSWSI